MKKRILSVFLAACLVFGLLPVSALATDNYSICVGGVWVTSDNTSNVTGAGITSGSGSVTYSAGSNTLTLNNATITGYYTFNSRDAGIYYSGNSSDLKIVLIGSNTIAINPTNPALGICSSSKGIALSGSGSLTITFGASTSGSYGINTQATCSITDCTLTVIGGDSTSSDSVGIYAGTSISISNATVTTTGGTVLSPYASYGIYAPGRPLSVQNSTVTAIGNDQAVYVGSVTLNNSRVMAGALKDGTDAATVANLSGQVGYKYVKIYGSTAVPQTFPVSSDSELTAAISAALSGDTIQLTGNFTNTAQATISDKSLILDLNGFTLSGERSTEENGDSVFLLRYAGSLEIKDSSAGQTGKLQAAKVQGIQIDATGTGGVTVSGGTVSTSDNGEGFTSAPYYAICNRGSGTVTVSGGAVSASGTSSVAIYSDNASGKIVISSGTVSSSGSNSKAIQSVGTANISGGTLGIVAPATLNLSGAPTLTLQLNMLTDNKFTIVGALTGADGGITLNGVGLTATDAGTVVATATTADDAVASKFTLTNVTGKTLVKSGADLVLASTDPITLEIGGDYTVATNTIGPGTAYGGATLQAAIGSVDLSSVKNLKITAGEVTEDDWAYIKNLTVLEHFEIAEGVTVADMPDCSYKSPTFPWSIFSVNLPQVTTIGAFAFCERGRLTTVSLPEVTTIGEDAFYGCAMFATLKLGATPPTLKLGALPPTLGPQTFFGTPMTNPLVLLDGSSGAPLSGSALTAAQDAYKAVKDWDPTDGLWYGWTVTATGSTGVSDTQAVAAAKAALFDGTVTVASGANQTAKTAAVQAYVNALLTGDAAGVTATVSYDSGTDTYTVTLTKGSVTDTKSLSMTVNESADPNTAAVAAAKTAAENAGYADMTQGVATNEAAIKAALKAAAEAAVGNSGVTVIINQSSYTAPVAGTAVDTDGTNGIYTFTVTVSKDGQSDTTGQKTITITATALPTYDVGGNVKDSTNTALEGASVKLMLGQTQCGATATTDASGAFTISGIANGTYNLVVSKFGIVVTSIITVKNDDYAAGTITLPAGMTNSVVEVKNDTPAIVVGKLNEQFGAAVADNDKGVTAADQGVVSGGGSVEIKLTAEEKTSGSASNGAAITAAATTNGNTVGIYLDLSVVKTVTPSGGGSTETTTLTELPVLIEVRIPLAAALQDKSNYVVYRYHGSAVDTITTTPNGDGEKIALADGGATIILTVKKFSTYAVGYTPAATGPTSDSGDSATSGTITAGKSDNGSVTVATNKKSATIVPDDGYVIADVLVDGKSVGATEKYTFADTGSHKISAVFISESALPYYLQNGERLYIGFSVITGKCYKYIAPAGVNVLFAENPKSFTDNTIAWAKPGIDFVTERELFLGTGSDSFSPNVSMTRGRFVTVIGRLYERSYGSVSGTGVFSDVPQDAYYAKYVAWASENGIIRGIGDNKFAPEKNVTREQMATIMLNFASLLKKAEVTDGSLRYPDSAEISAWAVDGAKFCQKTQVIMGRADGSFAPKDNATRAEVAAVIMRFIKTIVD